MTQNASTRVVPKFIALNRAYNAITRDDYTPESIDAAIERLYVEAFAAGRATSAAEILDMLNRDAPAHEVYSKVGSLATGLPYQPSPDSEPRG